jgi:uncharacterized protein involved in cysteine biosynthesis
VRDRLGPDLFTSSPLAAWIVLGALSALLGLVLFILIQPLVGAPFIDVLTERVEGIVRGRQNVPSVGLVAASWQALLHGLLKVVLYGLALLVGLALSALTGVGGLIGAALYGLFLVYDGFDYPLARRKTDFGGKWRYIALHPAQSLGYCLGASLLYLFPLAVVVAPPFAAVGATLTFLAAEPSGPEAPVPPTPEAKGPTA